MLKQLITRLILATFFFTSIGPAPDVSAQSMIEMPAPGMMVSKSDPFEPLQLKGILVNVKNPLRFDFLVDKGESGLSGQFLKNEITRLAKYFLTCLAVPENDLWVNLSPYEKDRIVPGNFGITLMGRDLLEQDYFLKQMMASLSYPENDLGKRFWQRVYRKSYELYGTTDIPINTFNKVWIIPKSAQVYAQGNAAFVVNSRLDVMLEADYKALVHHQGFSQHGGAYSQIFRDVILPELRQEINEGKNFAVVRQVYNAMILATWYKRHLKDSILGKMYVGRNEVKGVDIADKHAKEKIYQQYLKAYKKCVYNYIKEDYDPITQQTVPRKYASGGMYFAGFGAPDSAYDEISSPKGMGLGTDLAMATVDVSATNSNGAIVKFPYWKAEITDTHPFHQVPYEVQGQDAAMGSQKIGAVVRKILLPLIILVAVSVSAPAFAAQFTPNPDGTSIQVTVEKNDTFGQILLDAGYTRHYTKMSLWGPHGAVARAEEIIKSQIPNAGRIHVGEKFDIPTKAVFKQVVSSAVGSGVLTPAPSAPANLIATPPAPPVVVAVQPQQQQVSAASPPPPPEDLNSEILQNIKTAWPWYMGLAFFGIGVAAGAVILKKSKKKKLEDQSVDDESKLPIPYVTQASTSGSGLFDVALPPPPASPGEARTLAGNLADLRAVANGEITPPSPLPAEDDTIIARSGGQYLWWMDAGALLGSLSFSLWLDGGVSWMVAMSPFITRGFYVGQKWLHEIFHLASAVILYPTKISTTLSGSNLTGNLSLSQWVRSLVPAMRTSPSYVNLPFAKDKLRNQIVAKSGLIGSAALALAIGHFIGLTPLLIPLALSAVAVLKGSVESGDFLGSEDTREGIFGCGIIGFIKRVPSQGVRTKDMRSWLTWFFEGMETSSARGGQQAGVSSNFSGVNGAIEQLDEKITKQKRDWMFWQNWDRGPVFFRNMVNDLHARFYRKLPGKLVPVYNYAKFGVLKIVGHMRFATGGDMVEDAAHPFSSPQEKREQWFYDSEQNKYRKVNRFFNLTSAFNGDHNTSTLGVPGRGHLFGSTLGYAEMRSFFSAAVYSYYEKKVTKSYLKSRVSNGQKYGQEVMTNYEAVLQALLEKGYVNPSGYVNHRFVKLDGEFKSWFPDYKEGVFNEIESALFGIPPGDAPIIPLEQHLLLTQGNWFASLRYAHVMTNKDDILFEKEARAVGSIFSEVYDQVQPYLSRNGFMPQDLEKGRSLNDLFVKDKTTAESLGLGDQYQMIEIFKSMLDRRMQTEARQQTLAGEVFREWEQRWKKQGLDAGHMRRLIIDMAVEKFFTADNIAATKEFAERSEGTYGLFMQNPLDDSITLYQDNQDVVIGYNETAGVIAFGSDPRALKVIGPNGEKVEKVMHLKEGEVVNLSFSPSGKAIVRSWIKSEGKWTESTPEQLTTRTYPTAEYVDGVKNPYYAPPPVQYDNPRRVVQEDLQNIPKILARAQKELDDPDSFNSQSTEYLGERISDVIARKGRARLVIIGYDNSREIAQQGKKIIEELIAVSKLSVDVIDANEFNESPLKFDIKPDDIVMIVSKSGATFSTKLALRIVKALADQENIFCMSARIDSVLNTMIGQGLRPGIDKFTKRVFTTGEFYPSETPVVSEVLLMFQMQQLAVNLARALESKNGSNSLGLKFSRDRLEHIAPKITEYSIRLAQELTGFDVDGKKYGNTDKEAKAVGASLGKAALETFFVKWFMNFFVAGVLTSPALLLGPHPVGGFLGIPVWVLLGAWAALNVTWINHFVPFWALAFYRKMINRSPYGEAPFNLFIAAPTMIYSTQSNFFSRILTNRFKSISPGNIEGQDPKKDFVATFAPKVGNGDIILKISLKRGEGMMGPNQAAFPFTGVLGTKILNSKAEIREVVVKVPLEEMGIAKNEEELINNTVGILGLMIAAKTIGVEMAKVASFDGRLFNLSSTFSSAGVHTTQINPINEEARGILNAPGGIDMNSRLIQLNVTGEGPNRIRAEDHAMSGIIIRGVVPQVSGIVPVTPDMLKAMLGAGYLN